MEHFNWIKGALIPYINFALFLFMAVKFFKKPLSEMAKKRRSDYDSFFHEARQLRSDAEKQSGELKGRLSKLDFEIKELHESAKSSAEDEAARIIANAKDLAEHIKHEAQRIAEAEVENAKAQLRKEIVDTVKASVTRKIETELSADKKREIFKSRTKNLEGINL